MAAKPKARDPANKSRSEKTKQKEQSARFIKAAREFEIDETGKEFERALTGVLGISARVKAVRKNDNRARSPSMPPHKK